MHQIQLLRKYSIRLQKVRGQNFLIDENIQRKIVEAFALSEKDCVLEIGAGLGALTEGLAQTGTKVYAVEKDKRFVDILAQELASYENLRLLNDNILKLDFSLLLKHAVPSSKKKWKVVGNLPYFITSPILFHLIEQRQAINFAMVMVQEEVAERLLAQPGNKSYGRLTLALRYHADVSHVLNVSRRSFSPVPAVDSSVVKIAFHEKGVAGLDETLLFKIIQAAFSMRRKNILNCLSNSTLDISREQWKGILAALKIPENKRAEELLLKDYLDLTSKVSSDCSSTGSPV